MARLPTPKHESRFAQGRPTINVLKLLSHSAATVDQWTAIGNAQFTALELSPKLRELVILLCAAKFRSSYEWTHHVPISAKLGVTDEQRAFIKQSADDKFFFTARSTAFDDKESILLSFTEAVIQGPTVDEELWSRTRAKLSDREIVEVISLQGFYYTFARLTTVLDIEIDPIPKPKL